MSKKKRCEERIECIAYLSTTGNLNSIERSENRQEKYIREYAKAHNIDIVGVWRRHGFGMGDVNRQFDRMVSLIANKKVDGIIVANMMAISYDIPEAYYKVGKVRAAGGVMVTVDEGRLGMKIVEV